MAYGYTGLYIDFYQSIKDKPAEETVEVKYSKKGLYLYPRFEIHVTDSDRPNAVSRERFESIQPGDTINGYMKDGDTFVTEKDIQFDKLLGTPILIILYLALLAYGGSLFKNTAFFKKYNLDKGFMKKVFKTSAYAITILYILIGFIFITLTATNIIHKLNKSNQTEVTATVIGNDYEKTDSFRGGTYTIYELLLQYQDINGDNHTTKKAVTKTTYEKYDIKETVPLLYRNNDVYDTFIVTKGSDEIWGVFFNLYTFFLGFYVISVCVIIRVWRKKKRKQQETWSTA